MTGFHSTIDRPDSVSRVAPPTTTVTTIRAATTSSHTRMARRAGAEDGARLAHASFACGNGADHIVARLSSQTSEAMPLRLRKFIGAILLITLVVTWALVAMALAQAPAIKANGLIEVIYYVVAGLAWVLPAMPLVRWMSRPDAA